MKKLGLLILLLPLLVVAQIPDPEPGTYINDKAHVLSTDDRTELNLRLNDIEVKYRVQMAIILVDKLPEGIEIEDFAREIGRKWHVGTNDNGLIFVAAISQHKDRLEVARRQEGNITDIAASKILDNIKPYFRNADYKGGILRMLSDIADHLQTTQSTEKAATNNIAANQPNNYWFLWFLPFPVILLMWLIFRKEKHKEEERGPMDPYPRYRSSTLNTPRSVFHPYQAEGRITRAQDPPIIIPITNTSQLSTDSGSSSNDSTSSFGNWGNDSSPSIDSSSSADAGFSGGGASSDW